jgi:secreted trypsin-like serine protease
MTQKRVGFWSIVHETDQVMTPVGAVQQGAANESRWLLAASVCVEARKACSDPIVCECDLSDVSSAALEVFTHTRSDISQTVLRVF